MKKHTDATKRLLTFIFGILWLVKPTWVEQSWVPEWE